MILLAEVNVMNLALGLAQILVLVFVDGIAADVVLIAGMTARVIVKEHVLRIAEEIALEIVKVLV